MSKDIRTLKPSYPIQLPNVEKLPPYRASKQRSTMILIAHTIEIRGAVFPMGVRMDLAQQVAAGDGLTGKILLAAIGAAIGFAFSLILDRIKARREPRFQLSWEVQSDTSFAQLSEDARRGLQVLYGNRSVENFSFLRCKIENTGNQTVKEQAIRFTFPNTASLLGSSVDPEPEREIGLTDDVDARESPQDRIFRLRSLKPAQDVTFVFALDGTVDSNWHPYDSNETQEVTLQRRGASRAREDREHFQPFVLLILLLVTIPRILASLPLVGDLDELLSAAFQIVVVILLLPRLIPVSRVISDLISGISQRRTRELIVSGSQGIQVGDDNLQRIYYNTDRSEATDADDGSR